MRVSPTAVSHQATTLEFYEVSDMSRSDSWVDQDSCYVHLKEISVDFIKRRPKSDLELVFKDDAGVKHKSNKFKKDDLVLWDLDMYVSAHSSATITIRLALFKRKIADIWVKFDPSEFVDDSAVGLEDTKRCISVNLVCGRSQSLVDVASTVGFLPHPGLVSKLHRSLKLPQLAALPPPTPAVPYTTIHRLNDDILLDIFNCYRLDDEIVWNLRLGWCKLSHVCQRWRYLIYDCAFHLGMHIECVNGSPIVDTLNHIPPLPLFVNYGTSVNHRGETILQEQDELGMHHALRLHDRVRHIYLDLPSSILHKVLVLLDDHFPLLEHLSLSSAVENSIPLALPKAFKAPNLRHLALPSVSPPRRLQVLTSTVSLVTLELWNIQNSSYFRPRVLVARLSSLPQLEGLFILFSVPIPHPSAESELLGEPGATVTLPKLKKLEFKGASAYLESVAAQIRAPLLEQLCVTLFIQIAFALPHLSHLIDIPEELKLPELRVHFGPVEVFIITARHGSLSVSPASFQLRVMCIPLHWQIDCAAQICNALSPALSGVEKFTLECYRSEIPPAFQDGAIDSTMWHQLLRPFTGVKELHVEKVLLEELSRALQMDHVGSDPEFLPSLQSINAADNLFTTFIDTRQVVGRPVQFSQWEWPRPRRDPQPSSTEVTGAAT